MPRGLLSNPGSYVVSDVLPDSMLTAAISGSVNTKEFVFGAGAEREEDNWQAAHADHFPGSSFLGLAVGLGLLAVSDPSSPIGLSAARVRAAWHRQQRFLT